MIDFPTRPMATLASVLLCTQLAFIPFQAKAQESKTMRSFSTGGHSIYHLRCARDQGETAPKLFAAAYDGAVLAYRPDGKRIWENTEGDAFPLDLAVADIDGDGRNETLVASADGALRALGADGKERWAFRREPPLVQVCATHDGQGKPIILAGGMEKVLYALDSKGQVLKSLASPYVVRHIRCGDILGTGKPVAAVITAKNDRSRLFLQLHDPATLAPIWEKPIGLSTKNATEGTKYHVPWLGYKVTVFSMLICDLDDDGKDEIALTDHFTKKGAFTVYDGTGRKRYTSGTKGIKRRPYRMNLLTAIPGTTPAESSIFGLFGEKIIQYGFDGKVQKIHTTRYCFADGVYDAPTKTYFLGSSISGGDGIHALRLDRPDWGKAFSKVSPGGRIAEVERNLATLREQVAAFTPPDYQPKTRPTLVIADHVEPGLRRSLKSVQFSDYRLMTEDFDRSSLGKGWDKKRETRHKYNYTADQIVDYARKQEEAKRPFALWAGHGNDPFYMQLSTIKRVCEAAPTTLTALIYPEMTQTNEAMVYGIRKQLLPVAELCRKHGKAKLILRNKSVFWNANCYLDFWRKILLDSDYADVIVPSMEETNDRCQSVSLAGTVGLWLAGSFDRVSARAVTDNANFCRFWEWSSQQLHSHLLRAMVLRASLGADRFLMNSYQGDPNQLSVLYKMLDKGIVAIPQRDQLLSLSPVCIGMGEPDAAFVKHGNNGHKINAYEPNQKPMVFDRLDTYWAAAPTAAHDLSRYGFGSKRRMLDFLPTYPYGLVPILPAETDLGTIPALSEMVKTDGAVFHENGKAVAPPDYRATMEAKLKAGAAKLPILVQGQVAWSVVRLDANHVRIILLDSGYLDPAPREAEILFQNLVPEWCRDILAGEQIEIRGNHATLTVPAGSLRILDIRHK